MRIVQRLKKLNVFVGERAENDELFCFISNGETREETDFKVIQADYKYDN